MKSIIVFVALCAMAYGSSVAQPPHLPALVLDPHGRPLETAEVINSRALHLQAKALEGRYGYAAVTPYAHSVTIAPSYGYNSPLLVNSALGYAGHGHNLYKRSLGHVYVAPAAISHQSHLDLHSSPIVVAPLSHGAVLPLGVHGALAKINHAAVAPVGYASPYSYGYGYISAPLVVA